MQANQEPSLDDILAEVRARRKEQKPAEKSAPAAAAADWQAAKEEGSTLNLYIRYGMEAPGEEDAGEHAASSPVQQAPPVSKPISEPVSEPVLKPIPEAVSKPVPEPASEPVSKTEEAPCSPVTEAVQEVQNALDRHMDETPVQQEFSFPEQGEKEEEDDRPVRPFTPHGPLFDAEKLLVEDDDMTAYRPAPQFEKRGLTVDDAPTQSYDGSAEEKTMEIFSEDSLPQTPEDSEQNEKLRAYFSLDEEDRQTLGSAQEVEYESAADEEPCRRFLSSKVTSSAVRYSVLTLIALASLYLTLAPLLHLPLPALMDPAENPYGFWIAGLILGVAGGLCALREMAGGLMALFTFSPSTASLPTAAYLLSVAQLVTACFAKTAAPDLPVLMPVSLLILSALLLGELLFRITRRRSFRLVSSDVPKNACAIIDDGPLQQHMTRLSSYESCVSSVGVKTGFLTDFFALSRQKDPSGKVQKIAGPVLLLLSLLAGLYAGISKGNPMEGVTLAAALLALAAPMTATLSSASLLSAVNKRLFAKGAMVSGFETVDSVADTNGVVLDAADLFPSGTVSLHGVKTFEAHRIDEALLTVASVVYAAKSTYSNMFMEVIEGRTDILLPVSSFLYEDGMGISAWIQNRRVLVGNRELLSNHGVEVPSKDYEDRYQKSDRELMYLSLGGELAAMFILRYAPSEDVRSGLEKLHRAGFDLFIRTCDVNTTPEKIASIYGVDSDMLKLLPGSCFNELDEVTAPCDKHPATLAYSGGFASFAAAVYGCAKGKSALKLSRVLQWISLILSAAAVLFLFFAHNTLFNTAVLLAVSLFFGLLVWVLPLISGQS